MNFWSSEVDQFQTTAPHSLEALLSLIAVMLFPLNILLLFSNVAFPHLHVAGTSSHNFIVVFP